MTPQTATLVSLLMDLHFAGRPHGRNLLTLDHCECPTCEAWDAVEIVPQAAFDELDAEVRAANLTNQQTKEP